MKNLLLILAAVCLGAVSSFAQSRTVNYDLSTKVTIQPDTLYQAGDGSAAAPAYRFGLDSNTGFYRTGADEIGVSLGGVLRWRFTPTAIEGPDGNLLIVSEGTTADDFEFSIVGPNPAADRTVTFRDASGTVILSGDTFTGQATGTLDTDGSTALAVNGASFSGALGTDDTYNGDLIIGLNAGETVAQWELVRMNSVDSEFHLADADAAGEFPARGLAVAASTDGNSITVLVQGTVRNDAWNWTVGGQIYLSTTAGGLTQTAPSTSGNVVQVVGWAVSADIAYFNFTGHYVTVQ